MSTQEDVVIEKEEKTEARRPRKWKVIIHNDDVTPMDFVVELLMYVFNHDYSSAFKIMKTVHFNERGVAGVYPYEIAEQKLAESQKIIMFSGFSLKLSMEEE